jgi:flavin reductase (DIM6/NTAB) family NADH-FMN oxidoreductase RutF
MNGLQIVQIPFLAVARAIVLQLLLLVLTPAKGAASALLQVTTSPPLLDVPTYSLATLNKDGSTNMNIMTYATPISVVPTRVWTLGLYRETLTEENLRRQPTVVLQLLTNQHVGVVGVLGGTSGRDVDKRAECAKRGLSWMATPSDDLGGLELLPGCASYIHLCIQGGLVDAGSHLIAPYCAVLGMYQEESNNDQELQAHLKTGYLRELGIITPQGRVANQVREESNRGFRLQ